MNYFARLVLLDVKDINYPEQRFLLFCVNSVHSNIRGKKEIRNNWKQLRLVEGKWVDRDEHFSKQPQKKKWNNPRDQTGEKGYEAVI